MSQLTREQIYEQLRNRAEYIVGELRNHSNVSLDDLITLSVITIGHSIAKYPHWKDIAHKLTSDVIDNELLSQQKQ